MDAAPSNSPFLEFNLDPALAEAVTSASADQMVEGILRLEDPNGIPPYFTVVSQFHRICTGRFAAAHILAIRRHKNVRSFKAARPLGLFDDGKETGEFFLPENTQIPLRSAAPFGGRGCIVAALDFGLDFAHPNFVNPDGTTRIVAFWHQGAPYDPAHPNRYGYGRTFTPAEINTALRTSDPYHTLGYHPAMSDTGAGSHGTHTLDIAAGNGRVGEAGAGCHADLMFVHLSTPALGAVGDLGDSVWMLEALDYVERTAHDRPWVVNLSVGRTAGSHDGTSPVEQGMHELLRRGPGRAIVQSAGNYRAANLAVEGWLRDGEHHDLQWIIDPADATDNEIDVWYSGKDRFVLALRPPGGTKFLEVKLGEAADILHEGTVVGRFYHRRNDPNNSDNHGDVFLYPAAPHGVWTVRLIGEYVINGRFHAWIERDLGRPGAQSRFDPTITSQSYTLGTIATSPLVITVGAYDGNDVDTPLAPFSSRGPTRDGRRDKPELLAPGVGVVAARSIPAGAPRQEGVLVARSGTSMSAPHVTGTVAAMFEAAGRPVSIDEIRECLKRSAQPIAEAGASDSWGRLDTTRALREIQGVQPTMTVDSTLSDAAAEDFGSPPDREAMEVPVAEEGSPMQSHATEHLLDRAERALQSSNGTRHESEVSFLQQLLSDLGSLGHELSPAKLFREVVKEGSLMPSTRAFLRVVARPMKQPQNALRAGDWMLRLVPGIGDVGHVSVLASGDLLTPSALAQEGIAAESTQPGFYGTVIEGGAFPHTRQDPFARRVLDRRGRVPPHTVIVRPRSEDTNGVEDFTTPSWVKVERRSRTRFGNEPYQAVDAEETETVDDFTAPSWLKVEQRVRSGSGDAEFEDAEAFTFAPTGQLKDFTADLRKAWHTTMEAIFKLNIDRATALIGTGLSISAANAAKHVRFFSPASRPPSITLTDANVLWRAVPTRYGSPPPYKRLDDPALQGGQMLRIQDEYCEWQVFRDKAAKITRVVFTSEPPEYYKFLYEPGVSRLRKVSRDLLVNLYRLRCNDMSITLADLETTVGGRKQYDTGNKWNNRFCLHLQMPANTLGAQVNIAARAAILRSHAGSLITNVKTLINCDGFGDPDRQSDPSIGDNVNKLARENRFITLENPVGLYMTSLDTSGWTTPDGTDAQTFWKVVRGKTDKNPRKSMIVRAEFAVPPAKGYTVSDIKIAGVPISFGSHVAEHVEMRLGARFGPKDKDLSGRTLAAPTPVVC